MKFLHVIAVIVVIVQEPTIFPMIKAASQLGMGNGDYVFIVLYRSARFQYVSTVCINPHISVKISLSSESLLHMLPILYQPFS